MFFFFSRGLSKKQIEANSASGSSKGPEVRLSQAERQSPEAQAREALLRELQEAKDRIEPLISHPVCSVFQIFLVFSGGLLVHPLIIRFLGF